MMSLARFLLWPLVLVAILAAAPAAVAGHPSFAEMHRTISLSDLSTAQKAEFHSFVGMAEDSLGPIATQDAAASATYAELHDEISQSSLTAEQKMQLHGLVGQLADIQLAGQRIAALRQAMAASSDAAEKEVFEKGIASQLALDAERWLAIQFEMDRLNRQTRVADLVANQYDLLKAASDAAPDSSMTGSDVTGSDVTGSDVTGSDLDPD